VARRIEPLEDKTACGLLDSLTEFGPVLLESPHQPRCRHWRVEERLREGQGISGRQRHDLRIANGLLSLAKSRMQNEAGKRLTSQRGCAL